MLLHSNECNHVNCSKWNSNEYSKIQLCYTQKSVTKCNFLSLDWTRYYFQELNWKVPSNCFCNKLVFKRSLFKLLNFEKHTSVFKPILTLGLVGHSIEVRWSHSISQVIHYNYSIKFQTSLSKTNFSSSSICKKLLSKKITFQVWETWFSKKIIWF